jgi:hypothetical protein
LPNIYKSLKSLSESPCQGRRAVKHCQTFINHLNLLGKSLPKKH